jgi:hypothetical protein
MTAKTFHYTLFELGSNGAIINATQELPYSRQVYSSRDSLVGLFRYALPYCNRYISFNQVRMEDWTYFLKLDENTKIDIYSDQGQAAVEEWLRGDANSITLIVGLPNCDHAVFEALRLGYSVIKSVPLAFTIYDTKGKMVKNRIGKPTFQWVAKNYDRINYPPNSTDVKWSIRLPDELTTTTRTGSSFVKFYIKNGNNFTPFKNNDDGGAATPYTFFETNPDAIIVGAVPWYYEAHVLTMLGILPNKKRARQSTEDGPNKRSRTETYVTRVPRLTAQEQNRVTLNYDIFTHVLPYCDVATLAKCLRVCKDAKPLVTKIYEEKKTTILHGCKACSKGTLCTNETMLCFRVDYTMTRAYIFKMVEAVNKNPDTKIVFITKSTRCRTMDRVVSCQISLVSNHERWNIVDFIDVSDKKLSHQGITRMCQVHVDYLAGPRLLLGLSIKVDKNQGRRMNMKKQLDPKYLGCMTRTSYHRFQGLCQSSDQDYPIFMTSFDDVIQVDKDGKFSKNNKKYQLTSQGVIQL